MSTRRAVIASATFAAHKGAKKLILPLYRSATFRSSLSLGSVKIFPVQVLGSERSESCDTDPYLRQGK